MRSEQNKAWHVVQLTFGLPWTEGIPSVYGGPFYVRRMKEKSQIRKTIMTVLSGLPEDERRRQEDEVIASFLADPRWKACSWVFAFLPMGHEFDLEPLLQATLSSGKRLALPRVEMGRLQFHEVTNLDGPWRVHSYGMREPAADMPAAALEETAAEGLLVIVPGLAFDMRGYRVGYGGGFYDRLLSALPDSVETLSCLYREQLFSELPLEPHDRQVGGLFFPGMHKKTALPG